MRRKRMQLSSDDGKFIKSSRSRKSKKQVASAEASTNLDRLKEEEIMQRVRKSAVFSTLLYSRNVKRYEEALTIGTAAAAEGLLDLSVHYEGYDAWCGLIGSKNIDLNDNLVVRLFELILNNGGRKTINVASLMDETPLLAAITSKAELLAEMIASQPETDINCQIHGRTALMAATQQGLPKVCQALLSRIPEIDLDITNNDGQTADQMISNIREAELKAIFAKAKSAFAEYQGNAATILYSMLLVGRFPKVLIQLTFGYLNFPPLNTAISDSIAYILATLV